MDVRPILSHELVVGDYLGCPLIDAPPGAVGWRSGEYIDADLGQALGEPLRPAETGAATWSEALAQRSAPARTGVGLAIVAIGQHRPADRVAVSQKAWVTMWATRRDSSTP
jgi:hypothetical protein